MDGTDLAQHSIPPAWRQLTSILKIFSTVSCQWSFLKSRSWWVSFHQNLLIRDNSECVVKVKDPSQLVREVDREALIPITSVSSTATTTPTTAWSSVSISTFYFHTGCQRSQPALYMARSGRITITKHPHFPFSIWCLYISYQESGDDIDRDRKQRQRQYNSHQKSGDHKDKVRKQRQKRKKNTTSSHQKSGDDKALVGHGVLAHCLVTALLNSRMYIWYVVQILTYLEWKGREN